MYFQAVGNPAAFVSQKVFEDMALWAAFKRIIDEDLHHGGFLMNKVSFEQLYMEQLSGLYRLAQGILRHPADAQDAVQQAVLQAWQRVDTIRPGSEKAYLARIVINECRNIQRTRQRTLSADIPALAANPNPSDFDLKNVLESMTEPNSLLIL